MTNYPYGFDNNITLPGVSGSTQEDTAITALRSSVFAIEIELGITPSGIYPDVRTRLDILESRLQFGVSPLIPNDGYVKSPLFIWNVPQNVVLSISDGYGTPTEDRLSGSLYMRSDGYANYELYIRRNGAWYPIQTDLWQASGDLAGNYLVQEVIGIRTKPLDVSLETIGTTQDGYHLTWSNGDGYWRAETGFLANNDLAPAVGSGPTHGTNTGRTAQTVVGIQNRAVASTPGPFDGYALIWETADNHWDYQPLAVVYQGSVTTADGYVTRRNIRSNRIFQSPNTLGFVGMTNFGSSTDGSGGAAGNYVSILGGDRNSASGVSGYALVVNGFSNNSSDGYSTIVNGNANLASGLYATIINGTNNVSNALQSFIADGYSNQATAMNSFVINGGGNQAKANFSGILGGISNVTTAGAAHSGIGWGQFNTINSGGLYSIILGGSSNVSSAINNLIGPATNSTVSSTYSSVLNGTGHTINAASDHSVIVSGTTHTVSAASGFSFIGAGNNLTVTGLYATILNSTGGSANGLHSLILNGNTNVVAGSYATVVNGSNNTISGPAAYTTILDGYQNTVSGMGSIILDGYANSISGQWSTIGNGNFNTIVGRNSNILNGSNNTIDVTSGDATILAGSNNSISSTTHALITGYFNSITSGHNTYLLGSSNIVQSPSTKVIGSSNTVGTGGSLNRILGNNNTLGNGSVMNSVLGSGNQLSPANATTHNTILGSNNVVDGYSNSTISGQSNIVTNSGYSNVHGQYAKARLFGQEVRANSRFTGTTIAAGSNGVSLPTATINVVSTTGFPSSGTVAVVTSAGLQTVSYVGTTATTLTNCTGGTGTMSTGGGVGKIGEAQWSRLILSGTGTSGAAIPLQLQDNNATNPTFVDGYSYDMSIKVMVVNTSPISPNPVVPARFYIDVLAHQEAGVLIIDNVNRTLTTPQASGTNWTVSVSGDGLAAPTNNQFAIQVDLEVGPPYVQPSNTPSNRRAVATIEMREISRI